jgi:hypothetical protein
MLTYAGCANENTLPLSREPAPNRKGESEFDAIRGIIAGSGLAILLFWLPLAIALLHP